MKATVTSDTELTWDGLQTVQIEVTEGDKVLLSHSITCVVDQVEDEIKNFLREYKKKVVSKKRVKVGDSWEV